MSITEGSFCKPHTDGVVPWMDQPSPYAGEHSFSNQSHLCSKIWARGNDFDATTDNWFEDVLHDCDFMFYSDVDLLDGQTEWSRLVECQGGDKHLIYWSEHQMFFSDMPNHMFDMYYFPHWHFFDQFGWPLPEEAQTLVFSIENMRDDFTHQMYKNLQK